MLAYELVVGKPAFETRTNADTMDKIAKVPGSRLGLDAVQGSDVGATESGPGGMMSSESASPQLSSAQLKYVTDIAQSVISIIQGEIHRVLVRFGGM